MSTNEKVLTVQSLRNILSEIIGNTYVSSGDTTVSLATTTLDGLMSASDKAKLDSISSGSGSSVLLKVW